MKRVYYVSCFLLLAFTTCLLAAPPTLTGPEKVYAEFGDWAEIKVETTGKWVKFRPLDSGLKTFPTEKLKDNKATLVYGQAGKKYRVLAYTGNDDGGAEIEIVVVFGGSDIIPTPVPPEPEPDKSKVISDFWIVVVEESSQRHPNVAKVLGDLAFWKSLPGGNDVLLYDKDSPDAKKYKFDVMAKQQKLDYPVLMLVDSKGNLIKAETLPNSTTEVRSFIKSNTGK